MMLQAGMKMLKAGERNLLATTTAHLEFGVQLAGVLAHTVDSHDHAVDSAADLRPPGGVLVLLVPGVFEEFGELLEVPGLRKESRRKAEERLTKGGEC